MASLFVIIGVGVILVVLGAVCIWRDKQDMQEHGQGPWMRH